MRKGSRYWAECVVTLENGEKLYVEETEESIRKKIKSNEEMISLTTSGIYSSSIHIMKNKIVSYQKSSFF